VDNPDDKILALCKDPESLNQGFRLLVESYQERVYWHIRRMVILHDDADDLVQDTFVKVWKNLPKFRSDSGLYTWIYRIATNETLNFLKKKNKILGLFNQFSQHQIEGSLQDDSYFDGDEIQKKLQMALSKLPTKQRLVFNMKYYDEMKYEDISSVLGTSVGALKASYHIAVKKIEKYLVGN